MNIDLWLDSTDALLWKSDRLQKIDFLFICFFSSKIFIAETFTFYEK